MTKNVDTICLSPDEDLTLEALQTTLEGPVTVSLSPSSIKAIKKSRKRVEDALKSGEPIYGLNTGFGKLAQVRIPAEQLSQLQTNLILSHAAGVGDDLPPNIVRLVLLMKLKSLCMGYSGVRLILIDTLCTFLNNNILPAIPAKGSVGASGDLAPLAHMVLPLLGIGNVYYQGEKQPIAPLLKKLNMTALTLREKEGLALINGTQVSTALALSGAFKTKNLLYKAIHIGALTTDAALGSLKPFDERIHAIRRQTGQITVAKIYRNLLKNSTLNQSHTDCKRVQDPYCLRCQPQVLGACLDHIEFAFGIFLKEANAVTDNPLIFEDDIISGGNFHAEPVALASDTLAIALAEIGSISERRIALLIDPAFSQLPAFLVKDAGLNSGYMIAHVTAAALASDNKSLAHPRSVDSLPTSANQEDHVSMATNAARRLHEMADNVQSILAIEWLCAAQGVDFRRPLASSPQNEALYQTLREKIPPYTQDRLMADDIEQARALVLLEQEEDK